MINWKKGATFGVLTTSLLFSQAAFADQPTVQQQNNTTVTSNVYSSTTQLDQMAKLQQQLNSLQGFELKTAADSLKAFYSRKGDHKSQVKVEKEYLKKKFHKKDKDEDILKEYRELGQLLRNSGQLGVRALVNGEEPNMDVQPIVENGRTLLPFRSLAEALGAQVSFDQTTRTVTVIKQTTKVVLTLDSTKATVNGQPFTLDVPAKVVQGRTLIPLRFLGQSLNAKVLWEQTTQLAIVIGDDNTTATSTEVVPNVSTEEGTVEDVPSNDTTTDETTTPVTITDVTATENVTTGTTESVSSSN